MTIFRATLLAFVIAASLAMPVVAHAGTPGYVMKGSGNYAATRSLGKAVGVLRRGLLNTSPVNLSSGYFTRLKVHGGGRNFTYIHR